MFIVTTVTNMKINKHLYAKIFLRCSIISLLNSCSFINIFSPSPYQLIHDSNGNEVLRDTKGGREEFKSAVDRHIEHEITKDHAPGGNHDWHAFWMNRFRHIKGHSENSQWYVNYILDARRSAGLPKL